MSILGGPLSPRPSFLFQRDPPTFPDTTMMRAAVLALALVDSTSALQSPCSMSRVSMSRVASHAVAARAPMPFMCDAAEPAAEAPAEAVAEAPAADGEEAPARRARAPRGPKTKLEDLVTEVEMQGTVRSVQSYGAFVDIGAAAGQEAAPRLQEGSAAPAPRGAPGGSRHARSFARERSLPRPAAPGVPRSRRRASVQPLG